MDARNAAILQSVWKENISICRKEVITIYTIIMNADKSLTTSVKTTLYQREKLVDKIQFLLPQKYEDFDIKESTILLKYVDQGNVPHAEKLIIDEELYKERIRCTFDIDTNLTKFAGSITIYLDFLKLNTDKGIYESVLTSGDSIITILPRDDYFAYCPDEYLDVVNKGILELEAKTKALESIADTYNDEKADNLVLDKDNSSIYLESNGKQIKKSVIDVDELGNAIADETKAGMVRVIIEDELEIPSESGTDEPIKYTLQLNQDTDELLLLANGKIVSVIPTKDIGESIIDSTPEGLNEIVT